MKNLLGWLCAAGLGFDAPRGTRVAYRAGYYSPRPYAQLNPLEKLFEASSRLMGGEEKGAVPGAVMAAAFRAEGGKAYVPVLIEADGPALLGSQPPATLPVEVYIYTLDAGGGGLKVTARVLAADGREVGGGGVRIVQREATAAGGPDRLLAAFRPPQLPPGEYTLRVTVTGAAGPAGPGDAGFVVAGAPVAH